MRFETDPTQVRPYYDSLGDGLIQLSFTLPLPAGPVAAEAARQTLLLMNLSEISIVEQEAIDPQFTFFVAYARTTFSIDSTGLLETIAERPAWDEQKIARVARERLRQPIVVIGATLESDAHTVGLDAIFNMKGFAGHSGLEHYPCFRTFNLGAQVPFYRLIDSIRRQNADAVLISQTITQKGLHLKNLTRMVDLLEAEGLRSRLIVIVGGPNITPELAKELGCDAGFGRGTVPEDVAGFLIDEYLRRNHG